MTARELLQIFHKKLVAAYREAVITQDDRAWMKVAEYLSGLMIIQHAFGLREHRQHAVAFAEHQNVYGLGDTNPIEQHPGRIDWDAIVPGPDLTDDWKKLTVPERRAMENLLSWVATTRKRWTSMVDAERREAFFITGIHRRGLLDAARLRIAKSAELVEGPIGTAHALRELLPLGLERLETVVRTNMARARTQGEVEKWKQPHLLAAFPGARYRSTKGRLTRETHRAMDGFIILVEDKDFPLLVPPNGYNCTCWLERLTRRQCENEGLLEKNSDKVLTWKKWPSKIAAENWSRGLFPDKGFKHAKVG